jgi:hypothetical protein
MIIPEIKEPEDWYKVEKILSRLMLSLPEFRGDYLRLIKNVDLRVNELAKMANASGVGSRELFATGITKLDSIAKYMNDGKPPATIKYKKEGKFYRVLSRNWNE